MLDNRVIEEILAENKEMMELFWNNSMFHTIVDSLRFSSSKNNIETKDWLKLLAGVCQINQELTEKVIKYNQRYGALDD